MKTAPFFFDERILKSKKRNPRDARRKGVEMTIDEIRKGLESQLYCPNEDIEYAVLAACEFDKPVLIEGDPGTGKTSLAAATAGMLGLELVRLQMYDGLTDDKVLYDYDYQRQLLTLEAMKPKLEKEFDGLNLNESIAKMATDVDFYGKEFLIPRPVLRTIDGSGRKVFLIDEIDKASEETEYMLYEYLEDYSVTIPQYGKVTCPPDQRPVVFLTSNGYRELSGALRRRCGYLYVEKKSREEIVKILKMRVGADDSLANGIAACLVPLQESRLRHPASISEAVDWAKFLKEDRSRERALGSLGIMIKDRRDFVTAREVVSRNGSEIWS